MTRDINHNMRNADSPLANEDLDWKRLLDDARAGDDSAINRIWSQMRSYLLLVAKLGLADTLSAKVDASDIVQGSLLEAQCAFDRFTGSSELELKAWLKRIVKYNLVDSHRHYQVAQRRSVRLERPLNGGAIDEIVDRQQASASSMISRAETDLELIRAVSRLDSEQRRLIELRHRHDMTYDEISRELGVSERAVRNRWASAIAQLKKELCDGGQNSL